MEEPVQTGVASESFRLYHMPNELLDHITGYLDFETLKTLRLVSQSIAEVLAARVFRRVVVNLNRSGKSLVDELAHLANRNSGLHIRSLTENVSLRDILPTSGTKQCSSEEGMLARMLGRLDHIDVTVKSNELYPQDSNYTEKIDSLNQLLIAASQVTSLRLERFPSRHAFAGSHKLWSTHGDWSNFREMRLDTLYMDRKDFVISTLRVVHLSFLLLVPNDDWADIFEQLSSKWSLTNFTIRVFLPDWMPVDDRFITNFRQSFGHINREDRDWDSLEIERRKSTEPGNEVSDN